MSRSVDVVVYGATGSPVAARAPSSKRTARRSRSPGATPSTLAALAHEFPAAEVRVADARRAAAPRAQRSPMRRSCSSARVPRRRRTSGCSSPRSQPARTTSISAAIKRALHGAYERYESAARRAGRVVLIGAGDRLRARRLGGGVGGRVRVRPTAPTTIDDAVRTEPAARLADDRPLDDIAVSYVFDELVLSPSGQRAAFDGLHARGLVWRRDRWEHVAPAARAPADQRRARDGRRARCRVVSGRRRDHDPASRRGAITSRRSSRPRGAPRR